MPGDLLSTGSTPLLPKWLRRSSTAARLAVLASASLLLYLIFKRSPAPPRPAAYSAPLSPPPHKTQLRQLKGIPRSGMGGKMQRACGETEEGVTFWLNSFERMEEGSASCAELPGGQHERERLMKAGSRQCGSWCIWDLESSETVGWYLEERKGGGCFVQFSPPHHCEEWLGQRAEVLEKMRLLQ